MCNSEDITILLKHRVLQVSKMLFLLFQFVFNLNDAVSSLLLGVFQVFIPKRDNCYSALLFCKYVCNLGKSLMGSWQIVPLQG